jgi:hypothetical protein
LLLLQLSAFWQSLPYLQLMEMEPMALKMDMGLPAASAMDAARAKESVDAVQVSVS